MSSMADSVEHDLESRIHDFDKRTREATEQVDRLSPTLDRLTKGLGDIESTVLGRLTSTLEVSFLPEFTIPKCLAHDILQESVRQVHKGTDSAANLQTLLDAMIHDVLKGHAEAASAREESLQALSRTAESEMNIFMAVVAAAVSSTTTLQDQIVSNIRCKTTSGNLLMDFQELSRLQAAELEHRQNSLERVSSIHVHDLRR